MATLEQNYELSQVELVRREHNGEGLYIAKKLQKNAMFKDAPWDQANSYFADKSVKWDELPGVTHRLIGNGIDRTAGVTKPIEEKITLIESMSVTDKKLAEVANDKAKFRNGECDMHLEAIARQGAADVIYGDTSTDPANIDGLHTRYQDTSLDNVWSAGGSGSEELTSLWLIEWDVQSGVCFIYPKDSMAGISHEDLGDGLFPGLNGKDMMGYGDYFQLHFGLRIKLDEAVQRVCNIETSGTSNTLDYLDIIDAKNQLPNLGEDGNAVIYVNRTLKSQFDKEAIDKNNAFYTSKDLWGAPVTMFQNMQVRLMEAILDTESTIS